MRCINKTLWFSRENEQGKIIRNAFVTEQIRDRLMITVVVEVYSKSLLFVIQNEDGWRLLWTLCTFRRYVTLFTLKFHRWKSDCWRAGWSISGKYFRRLFRPFSIAKTILNTSEIFWNCSQLPGTDEHFKTSSILFALSLSADGAL